MPQGTHQPRARTDRGIPAYLCRASLYLARACNPLTGTLTLLTAVGYVAIYTPLKRVSPNNPVTGAFPGALPPLIGWTAARGIIEWPAVALFAILFVWQFPHFMAIGWMYRTDYARAGIRLTATSDGPRYAARSSGVQAVFYAVLMIAAALWPFALGITGRTYAGGRHRPLAGLSVVRHPLRAQCLRCRRIGYAAHPHPQVRSLVPAIVLEESRDTAFLPARHLLRASVIYLPLLLAAMMLDARGRLLF